MKEMSLNNRRYYLSEFSYYDGNNFVIFNIVDIAADKITVAITFEGRISVCTFDLKSDEHNCLFFEYGVMCEKIAVDDFEQVEEGF